MTFAYDGGTTTGHSHQDSSRRYARIMAETGAAATVSQVADAFLENSPDGVTPWEVKQVQGLPAPVYRAWNLNAAFSNAFKGRDDVVQLAEDDEARHGQPYILRRYLNGRDFIEYRPRASTPIRLSQEERDALQRAVRAFDAMETTTHTARHLNAIHRRLLGI